MTSDAIDSAVSPFSLRLTTAWRRLVFPGWLFAIVATLLFAFLILFGLLAVVWVTYSGTAGRLEARMLDLGWALLSLLALLWALVNLVWLAKAAALKNATATYGHLAVVIGCGLTALGIHFVLFAHSISSRPIVMDYSHRAVKSTGSAGPPGAVVEGDAEEGRKIFSTTCITCHGPTGGGMPNLAPSLRGSPFIASADAGAIADVIRLGRAPTDPTNKTKKVMPARGGNPFLGDDKIAHLVAFVQAIQNEDPGQTSATEDPNAPPPVQLAKWVVPTATAPPKGMVQLAARDDVGDAKSIGSRNQDRRLELVRAGSLGLTGIHCLLLIGVMIASSNVLIRDLWNEPPRSPKEASHPDDAWWSWSTLGWVVATVVWLFIFLVGFVMT